MEVHLACCNDPVHYTISVDALPTVGGCSTVAAQQVCTSATATSINSRYAVTNSPATASARLDTYAFTLPGGGVVTLPCVVVVSPVPADPCLLAGGTSKGTLQMLTDTQRPPSAPPGAPYIGVNVCDANLVVTVDGIGVNSFPGLIVC